jgi:hypothetical protein
MKIDHRSIRETLVYFLCFSLFLSLSGFPYMTAEAREIAFPIGEIVSRGSVKYEVKEKLLKNIESSHFPIFQKGKIKTGKGTGIITMTNNCQIEVDQNSTLSFDFVHQFRLSQGRINFRIPPNTNVIFKVENLIVEKSISLQASKTAMVGFPKNEEMIGSISLHPNGSVTVRSLKSSISIMNEDHVVIAALSSKESITIPSIMASGKPRTIVAQAGEIKEKRRERMTADEIDKGREYLGLNAIDEEWEYLGLNAVQWIGTGYAAALLGGLAYLFWPEGEKERRAEQIPEQIPLCP